MTAEPLPLDVLADWHDYQARNRRANTEYAVRPSIIPLLIDSLQRNGPGATCRLYNVPPGALASWLPEFIDPTGGGAS